jgi:hypothetical protein
VLTDFTPKHVSTDRVTVFAAMAKERTEVLSNVEEPSENVVELIDYELKVKEAFVAGRESGQAEAAVLFEAEKIRLERQFQDDLGAAETMFMEQTGSRMAIQIGDGLNAISSNLSSLMATILTPLFEENLRTRAVEAFAEEIEKLTKGLDAISLDVTGPRHLLDAFRKQAGESSVAFIFTESDETELSLKLVDAVVETRLGCLIDTLRGRNR